MTGHYIEKYFPSKNVRYIAVNDGIDTYTGNNDDITPFKSVINDMYAKDISKKVRTAMTTKKLNGEFIGSIAPYGYMKDKADKNKLVIDEETACIVRRIFKMFIETQSVLGIMKQLSREKIPTPSALKNLTNTQKGTHKGLWSSTMIKRILTNPTYIGNLTQNRKRKVSYKVNKQQSISKDNWIIIPNTHEAIVSEEDFNTVQNILTKRNYNNTKRERKPHILSGLVFCGDCKRPMTFMTKNKDSDIVYVICATRKKYGKLCPCASSRLREDYLIKLVTEKIRETAHKVNADKVVKNTSIDKQAGYINNLNVEQAEIIRQLDEIKTLIVNLYKDKVKNIISEQHFIAISNEFNNQEKGLAERLKQIEIEINQMLDNKNNILSVERILNDFLQFENMDRVTLTTLINRIEIQGDKKATIIFSFNEP
jgi:hypothetical protein